MMAWEFERNGEVVKLDVTGPLTVSLGGATDLLVDAAIRIVASFEDWLRPHFESGALQPVLEPRWQCFAGPYLYYPGRRLCWRHCGPLSISSRYRRTKFSVRRNAWAEMRGQAMAKIAAAGT
jgi:hypothetical protein